MGCLACIAGRAALLLLAEQPKDEGDLTGAPLVWVDLLPCGQLLLASKQQGFAAAQR